MKNALCPYYGICLDNAARHDLAGWDCAGCIHQKKQARITDDTDLIPETLLLWALFEPRLYKLYRDSEGIDAMVKEKKKKRFYRPDEIAWELGVSTRTIYRLIANGELIAFSVRKNGAIRILAESFERYVDQAVQDYQAENGISVTGDDRR